MLRTLATVAALAYAVTALAAAPLVPTTLEVGKSGLPVQIAAPSLKTPRLLAGPMTLAVTEGGRTLALPPLVASEPRRYELPAAVEGLVLSVRYGRGKAPYLELQAGTAGDKPRSVTVALSFLLRPEASEVFFPATDRAHEPLAPGEAPRVYGYAAGGISTALPLGQLYSAKQDWGLAFFQQLGLLVEPWLVTVAPRPEGPVVTVALPLALTPGAPASRRLYFAATRGDWRPALGAVLAEFPAAFKPPHPEASGLDGPFVCSGGTPADKSLDNWQAQGCGVVEIHATFPFYGDYVPTRESWTPLVDDAWHQLKSTLPAAERPAESDWRGIVATVEKARPPAMTAAGVRDYVDRLHAHRMKGLIYYNPTEAWAPWAADNFRDDVRYDAQGKPVPTWYESSCMVPDVNRPWGRHILGQLRGQLAAYPRLDGVFFDQSAGGGHDLTVLCHEASKLVRARGGLCWWNGPYNMELAALADGMMTEGGGSDTYRDLTDLIQYYGLVGKPCVSLGAPGASGFAEMLSRGVQPQPVPDPSSDLWQSWSPLFFWLRGRQWVLEAHALASTPGFESNLYRVAGANLLATLVPRRVWAGPPQWRFEVPLTVCVPEAAAIKGAYLLTPDLRGYHRLELRRQGNRLAVTVPRVRWAAAVVLAREGVFPALTGPLHVVAGQAAQVSYVVDNWTSHPAEMDLKVSNGRNASELRATVKPGASARTVLPLPALDAAAESTVDLYVSGHQSHGEMLPIVQLAVDPPVRLMVTGPARVPDDQGLAVEVQVLSHLPAGTALELALASPLVAPASAPQPLVPQPGRLTSRTLPLKVLRAGEGVVAVTARRGGEVVARAECPLQVVAGAIAPGGLRYLQAATLELEAFGVDGGAYAHKPVSINGAPVGDLPSGSGHAWVPVSLPLPQSALGAVAEGNEVSIDNAVGDSFKVRGLRLLLTLKGGVQVLATAGAGVYTGSTDWPYGEGKQFAAGQPLTGLRLTVPVDPARRETYEWFFGTPQSGRLVLEVFGSDTGRYEHKPVTVNGCLLGNLSGAPEAWTEVSLPLTAEALAKLQATNTVQIENSDPVDAFKVRRGRLEITNTVGRAWTSTVDETAHTSCGWDYQEGQIGSPIVVRVAFRE